MLIFALIFKNSGLAKADLSYKSQHVFKFHLCLIGTAQYYSENNDQKIGQILSKNRVQFSKL